MKKIFFLKKSIIRVFFVLILSISLNLNLKSQNIAITDDDSYVPDSSAMLDVMSTDKGMLIPRMTTDERLAIGSPNSPATGLMVFDTDFHNFFYYNGLTWMNFPQAGVSGFGGPLFHVLNSYGDTVFAVYDDGVRIVIPTGVKGTVGGFAVSGRNTTKGLTENYMVITPDSARIYINDTLSTKRKVGGFAVSGRNTTKGLASDYLVITPDSARIYINDTLSTKRKVGGFAVSGRNTTKGTSNNIFLATADSTRIYIDGSSSKGTVGGFAVSGRNTTKAGIEDYFNISGNTSAEVINNEPRVMWYPQKAALLAGEIHVGSADSVGENSTALGYRSIAMGEQSQAFGYQTQALGNYSTAIGKNALASSDNSFAFGNEAKALNLNAYAFGDSAQALGESSTAFGTNALAQTNGSYAIGIKAQALGTNSFAIGSYSPVVDPANPGPTPTVARGAYSFAFGRNAQTGVDGDGAFAIGTTVLASGAFSLAMGYGTFATGRYSFTAGATNTASGQTSTAFGQDNTAGGKASFAAGQYCMSSGSHSFALGYADTSSGYGSIALGGANVASGKYSIALGELNNSIGLRSFSAGIYNTSSGDASIALGRSCVASGFASFASGYDNHATNTYSTAMGLYMRVDGENSFGIGLDNIYATISQAHTMAIMHGRVGIGTVAPYTQLHLGGTTDLDLTDNSGVFVIGDIDGNNIAMDGNEIMARLNGSGTHLHLNHDGGDVYVGGSLVHASDLTLKKDINNLEYGLNEILKLRSVSYNWKNNTNTKKEIGFIAQEVEEIIDNLVHTADDETGKKGINYIGLTPVIVNAIKEQQQIIETLDEKIILLEKDNQELQKTIKEQEEKNIKLENRLVKIEKFLIKLEQE